MKTILILSLMLFNVIFAVEPKDKSEVSIAEEKELIAKIIKIFFFESINFIFLFNLLYIL